MSNNTLNFYVYRLHDLPVIRINTLLAPIRFDLIKVIRKRECVMYVRKLLSVPASCSIFRHVQHHNNFPTMPMKAMIGVCDEHNTAHEVIYDRNKMLVSNFQL